MGENLLTQKEVTEVIGISRTTLFRLVKEGLSYIETPTGKKLFREEDVRSYVQTRRQNLNEELVIGKQYSNTDIVEIFKVGNMGAMRRSHSRNLLVLISCHDDGDRIYNDYWKDDVLYFTGSGRLGNQELTGMNKVLAESNKNGVTVYLFEVFCRSKYQYRGIVKLISEPFTERACDANGAERKIWKFPLKLINDKDVLDMILIDEQENHLHNQIIENIGSTLELFASASQMALSGSERMVKIKRTQFNQVIAEYVYMRAEGKCELCGCNAPFEYRGKPYLELEHIIPISEGGMDSINNIVAVCPNCHRKITMLGTIEDITRLRRNMKINEKKLSKKLKGEVLN